MRFGFNCFVAHRNEFFNGNYTDAELCTVLRSVNQMKHIIECMKVDEKVSIAYIQFWGGPAELSTQIS